MTTGLLLFEACLGGGIGLPLRFFALGLFGGDYFSAGNMLVNLLFWCALTFAMLVFVERAWSKG